ncbi:oxygen-independent coproporphyrinogen-3 oxidase [Noviherbaspirillum humi]|uniref:Coproporphyrinogen-III oxidase n=1 Tax=Noviherbaspirillum humi TaxID=1688639 RepID=A0A239IST0_9BURK|nr:oxygen-independent coproporphyrinogen III oxidase [Noviherbaspirillum humi]SNS96836.1 oxygen-independent coproporphyrinogen-3 oxidase [Noviherbaspirillum humi]
MSVAIPHESAISAVRFDPDLVRRLSQLGPRYTSYPTADRFTEAFRVGDYLQSVSNVRTRGARNSLSLYVHIPFCENLCYYCACNKIVTKNRSKAETYLTYLKREIEMQGKLFAGLNRVEQLHFGGGTPTYLSDTQMEDLMAHLRRHFQFADDQTGEYSIEIDPRTVDAERIHSLRRQGFNRISLGVQDFDPEVQKAVNRVQSDEQTLGAIAASREAGFRSISIDLIYGLPKQSEATMAQTLAKVIQASPDRISIYNYAHLPHLFKAQRRIADHVLPDPETKLRMLALCIDRLTAAGYVYIGMDHFAKPTDDLAVAQRQGRLHRNFQGYSTHAEADMVSVGVSAISAVGASYSQNEKTLDAYYERIEMGELPVARGIALSSDDLLRRIIIQMLMCNFELSISALELVHPITFEDYFAPELQRLRQMEKDGLVAIGSDWITVTPAGRLLVRNICMVFDRYLTSRTAVAQAIEPESHILVQAPPRPRYSQTI